MFRVEKLFLLLCLFLSLVSCSSDSRDNDSSGNVISGIVADDPIAQALVTVVGDNDEILGSCVTDDFGAFLIEVPDAEKYRITSQGGTLNGAPFDGIMENICDETGECNVTPLTTVAVHLADTYRWSLEKAGREARKSLGLKNDCLDPFVLAVTGEKKEDGTIEGLNQVSLDVIRSRILGEGLTFAEWLSTMLENVPDPYSDALTGAAMVESPLAGAEVRILIDGEESCNLVTDSLGEWQSPERLNITEPFRVEVTGGESYLSEFVGTLSAYIPYRASGRSDEQNLSVMESVNVGIISTLIDRYMQQSGKDYDDACAAVKKYLNIPEDVDPNDDFTLPQYFSDYLYMELCSEKSGFDAFTEDLVTDVDTGEAITIGGPANLRPYVTQATWGGKIVDGVLCGAVSAGLGFGLKVAESYLVPALGFETPEQALQRELEAIRSALERMDEKLEEINTKTDEILNGIKELLSEHEITRAQAGFTQANVYAGFITDAFDQMINLKTYEVRQDSAPAQRAFQEFAEIKTSVLMDALSQIHTHLYDVTLGYGSMDSITRGFEAKIRNAAPEDKGRVLWDCYQELEQNFSNIMGVQMEGILLVLNKYNWEEGISEIQSDVIEDTDAWSYLTQKTKNPYSNILKQTDLFQTYVERLVVASANTKTVIVGGYDMFPSVIEDVFYHADLLAQVFSPKHRAGFVYRVIGDPKIIHLYHYNNYTPNYFGSTATLFSVEDQLRRDYAAPLPEDYPNYYLGWSFDAVKNYHFDKRTTIQVVKMHFKGIDNGLSAKNDDDFPFSRTYNLPYGRKAVVEYDRVNPTTGRRYTQQDVENGVIAKRYGHATVISRILPKFTFEERDEITTHEGSRISMEHGYDFESSYTYANIKGEPTLNDGKICAHINMSMGIVSDEADDTVVDIHGTVREEVTNTLDGKNVHSFKEELYWDISVGEGTIFGRHFDYNRPYWGDISGSHLNDVEGGREATWSAKVGRKLYLNTRNYVDFYDDFAPKEPLRVDFQTKVLSFELK